MAIQRFEDIIAWQKSQDYVMVIYKLFEDSRGFSFRNQICDAVVSISNNIAEGFDRSSNAEFKRFLYYPIGSCSEVKSMFCLAQRLDCITAEDLTANLEYGNEISKIIRGLIKSIE
ncbi:MAG: four helix bundle protein [Chitinophagales bacterium]